MHCTCEYKDYDKLCYLLEISGAYSVKTDFAEYVDVFFSCDSICSAEITKKINDNFGGRVAVENKGEFTELRSV
jgi:putative IMPACT (imprinted ancient) family translation regulator